ncbi:MOSC domain-containing protein [Nocardioides perillae]|uniref:MOSC domain-containing protein n=1 Tax=Nocardioides perillae TaxID=1119534 RepID=A0A7Y9RSC3_9ACTN|nr:MOSC N-terminal beta barrel domain-containing protein [Nocardioides perillae]NYG55732.1 hypothetical protein [Nocardioides perillae]
MTSRPGPSAARVTAIRRYPVKSMGGEDLAHVDLDARGLVGDRLLAVVDADGHLASGKSTRRFRRRDAVFDFAATTDAHGVVVSVAGERWRVGSSELDAELTARMGTAVSVLPEGDVPHQDDGAVSLVGTATLAWCAVRWGGAPDPRRLRANLVLQTDEPFVEESWVGHEATLGTARLDVVERVPRCRMVDVDQDGAVAASHPWLTGLGAERDLCVAVYADVAAPGRVAVGDEVRLSPR